jgi:phage-related protein (TIGR01555 family)
MLSKKRREAALDLIEKNQRSWVRQDGWANLLTGMGIKGRDATAHTTYLADARLEYYELTQIYRGDGIARKAVDRPVHDMYREWFDIEGDTDGIINTELRKLQAKKNLKRAQRFGYLYGGALAILGIEDGGTYADPVNEKKIRAVRHIHVFDRWRVTLNTADLYIDPDVDKYGKPEYYNIVPIYGTPFRVHESRVLRYEGVDVADQIRIQNQGWGDSIIQSMYGRMRGLGESYDSIENILKEFIIGILTIDNLQELIANGKEGLIQKRLSQIDLSKHIINSVLVDKEEKYERVTSTVGGLGDLIDRLIEAVSAVTSIPVSILMGRSVAGLSDAETGQTRFYYDKIAAQQEEDALPQIEQLIRYINIAEGNPLGEEWKVNFKPLWQPTQKDLITTRNLQAQIDKMYADMGAVYPEEIGQSRFGGDQYSYDTILSDAHKAELEAFAQSPDGNESAIAEQKRREEADSVEDGTKKKQDGHNNDGGQGSGNFGHEGRPGEIGGSGGGGILSRDSVKSGVYTINEAQALITKEKISEDVQDAVIGDVGSKGLDHFEKGNFGASGDYFDTLGDFAVYQNNGSKDLLYKAAKLSDELNEQFKSEKEEDKEFTKESFMARLKGDVFSDYSEMVDNLQYLKGLRH